MRKRTWPAIRAAVWTVLLLGLATVPVIAQPAIPLEERILSYDSVIRVERDGTLLVTETIKAMVLGEQIRRGIYRDFPTLYEGPFFTKVKVPFNVLRVERNGQAEDYHTEALNQGVRVRVYIGSADRFLPHGEHTFTIEYSTSRQLGFFEDYDELYWNVTGNEWSFPIDRITATVRLPQEIPRAQFNVLAFTGAAGEQGQDYEARVEPVSGEVRFATTRAFREYEGLSIVVAFPRGFIARPTNNQKLWAFLASNPFLAIGLAGTILVLTYFTVAWVVVGRDPEAGVVVPLYEPPMGLAPAGTRYLREMGYDDKCFTAALINLAVKGHVKIVDNEGDYKLQRLKQGADGLSLGEQRIAKHLLSSQEVELKQKNHSKFRSAIRELKTFLAAEYEGKHFVANRWWLVPGIVSSVLVVLIAAFSQSAEYAFVTLFMSFWLTFWTVGVYSVVKNAAVAWGKLVRGAPGGVLRQTGYAVSAIFMTLFALPFVAGEVIGLIMLMAFSTIFMAPLLLTLATINWLFFEWIKRPTGAGRKVMDQIEGFRTYLAAVEGDRLNLLNRPERTPELFEKYLPYAVALDVENEWAEQFSGVLAAASQQPSQGGYRPSWYHGDGFHSSNLSRFSSNLGSSLSSAISASSTAPGSRSGSSGGGGGSSGGGGGGGGGGGW